jgi:hypothetical protein
MKISLYCDAEIRETPKRVELRLNVSTYSGVIDLSLDEVKKLNVLIEEILKRDHEN